MSIYRTLINAASAVILTTATITAIASTNHHGQYIKVPCGKIYVENYGKSKPTVVFLAGYGGEGVYTWRRVAPAISQFAHVVLYDRLDISGANNASDRGRSRINKAWQTKPLTGEQIMQNLQTVLHKLKLKPPYIIVGHSYGGTLAIYFARKYPKQVKSVVLVDATSPQTLRLLQKKRGGHHVLDLPPKNVDYYPEGLGMSDTLDQMKKLPAFPNVPLMVLSATYHYQPKSRQADNFKQSWLAQNNLAKLSPQSQLVWADTGHFIQLQRPWVVIAAVKETIDLNYFHVCKQWSPWNKDACQLIKAGKIKADADFSSPLPNKK
ncbi:MAG: alpha/beta hydrolase [Coxiellaceae bacterium]|nr:alpha/beta hydrolase [Coxiellaceae bacterium]